MNNYSYSLVHPSQGFETVIPAKLKFGGVQHRFLSGRTADAGPYSFMDIVSRYVINRSQVDFTYFDVAKAFDMVHGKVLVKK